MTTESYCSIPEASAALGIPEYALRDAIKRRLFPVYQPFSKRWAVKVSEIEAAIALTQMGRAGQ